MCDSSNTPLPPALVSSYFSKRSIEEKEKRKASENLLEDGTTFKVKLECDINIDEVDANTLVFYGLDNDNHSSSTHTTAPMPARQQFPTDFPVKPGNDIQQRYRIYQDDAFAQNINRQVSSLLHRTTMAAGVDQISSVHSHLQTKQDQYNLFSCDICPQTFKYQSQYQQHLRTHSGSKPYQCDRCGKQFTQNSNLKRHLLSHSLDPDGFECNICNARFDNTTKLKAHKLLHIPSRNQLCELCGEKFSDFLALRAHINAFHKNADNRAFACNACGKTFDCHSHWKTHMMTHGSTKPFHCNVCRKTFTHASSLGHHMLLHSSGDSVFECDVCFKQFQHDFNLRKHKVNIHGGTGEAFMCPVCNKCFKHSANLNQHQRVCKEKTVPVVHVPT